MHVTGDEYQAASGQEILFVLNPELDFSVKVARVVLSTPHEAQYFGPFMAVGNLRAYLIGTVLIPEPDAIEVKSPF